MTKTLLFLSCLFLALNTATADSSPPTRAESAVAHGTSETASRHVTLDRVVAAPRRFVLEPAGEEQALRALSSQTAADASAKVIIAPPRQIGFGRDLPALDSSSATRAQLDWQGQPDGGHAAALAIVSPDAVALRLGLRIFKLPAEALVRVHAPNETTAIVFTGQEITALIALNLDAGEVDENAHTWWSPVVEGNETVLEILLPPGIDPAAVDIALPRISHLFTSARTDWQADWQAEGGAKKLRELVTVCTNHRNASCDSDWDEVGKATAGMVFSRDGNSFACTGTLLADNALKTDIPYFITARHCISTQSVASTLTTRWFYRQSCNSSDPANETRLYGGARLLYSSSGSTTDSSDTDITLLRLNNAPPSGAVYAEWDTKALSKGMKLVGIHHPAGDPQKISFSSGVEDFWDCRPIPGSDQFNCSAQNTAYANHFRVNWNTGTVEGGSSGSGIFDTNKKLRGILHGGSGECDAKEGLYGRFDLAYADGINKYLDNTDGRWTLRVLTYAGKGSGTVTSNVSGINCHSTGGVTCSAAYDDNTQVTLTAAVGNSTTIFGGWLVGGSSTPSCPPTSTICTVTLNSDLEVTAIFNDKQHVRVSEYGNPGSGTVTSSDGKINCTFRHPGGSSGTCSHDYPMDSVVTFTATAAPGNYFGGWSQQYACSHAGSTETCTITTIAKNSDYIVNTVFYEKPTTPTSHNLSVQRDASSTGTGKVKITANTNCTITTTGTSDICSQTYVEGSIVELTAIPDSGSHFVSWSGACVGSGMTCRLTTSKYSDILVDVRFDKANLTLTVQTLGSGTVTGGINCGGNTTCSATYSPNTTVTLTASAAANNAFQGWGGACAGNSPTCTLTMSASQNVTAIFAPKHTLTVTHTGSGTVRCNGGACLNTTTYPENTAVTLDAIPNAGNVFAGWGEACAAAASPSCTIIMSSDKRVSAAFTLQPNMHALTVDHAGTGSGTVRCNGGACLPAYPANTAVTLTATPDAGSAFAGWGEACAASATATTCAITLDADKTVSATFNVSNVSNPQSRTLTVSRLGNGGGKVSGAGIDCGSVCTAAYANSDQVILAATPEAGSYFSGWGGACAGISPTCVFSIGADQDVTARFDVGIAPWLGDMALRDAIYAYKLPISGLAAQAKTFAAYNCDVFQVLIDVESGFVDLSISEDATAHGPRHIYPDRLYDTAAMFSYTLYSSAHAKSFRLSRYLDNVSSSAPVGTATVFGYCFSTRTDAVVLVHDASTGLCHRNGGITMGCPTVPVALSHPLPED